MKSLFNVNLNGLIFSKTRWSYSLHIMKLFIIILMMMGGDCV